MSVDPEAAEATLSAELAAESMIRLWQRAHEDVAPTVSDEQMRTLLALECERSDPGRIAEDLGIGLTSMTRLLARLEQRALVRRFPAGEFRLTGSGKCVLEATRQRRRQLLEEALMTAVPADRLVLRDLFNQLYGRVSPLAQVPRSRTPI
ncbi:MarR family winged helix-turn-helix transcriptional regulator [Streptomyces sp. NPDC052040]|uniref:MarR family winged helix-turn-helix transcriptional regulator n=1 Tax=unclassified Streptomyces TaxID=2593676 RepID=UPI0037CD1AD3